MNCIPSRGTRQNAPHGRAALLLLLLAGAVSFSVSAAAAPSDHGERERIYHLDYRVTIDPEAKGARVILTLTQTDDYLRKLDMSRLDGRIDSVSGDGEVSVSDERIVWEPPAKGGSLRWFVHIDHLRSDNSYDAYLSDQWGLFRADDIIPSAHTRTLRRAKSRTHLSFELPKGWSSLTPYLGSDDSYDISDPRRRFDTPTGWIVVGNLGVRYERIAGIHTNVAAPVDQGARRMDILALLRWTLPELVKVLPDYPQRLTIVSAGDPMWRGGLSAPGSLYIHADRPLISENGTSTLLHEAVHVGLGISAEPGADWIVEGLAEYYGLELLRRSGTIGKRRYRIALDDLAKWGGETKDLCGRESSGSKTARAVTILAELDSQIKDATDGKSSLDDAMLVLAKLGEEKITLERFRAIARNVASEPVKALQDDNLPGCG